MSQSVPSARPRPRAIVETSSLLQVMNPERIPGQLETDCSQIACRQRGSGLQSNHAQSNQLAARNLSYKHWGHYLLDFLTGQQQISIREQQWADGTLHWCVYDPHAHSYHIFNSQSAVRAWLEQRYYR
jgi:hypothetical protein